MLDSAFQRLMVMPAMVVVVLTLTLIVDSEAEEDSIVVVATDKILTGNND